MLPCGYSTYRLLNAGLNSRRATGFLLCLMLLLAGVQRATAQTVKLDSITNISDDNMHSVRVLLDSLDEQDKGDDLPDNINILGKYNWQITETGKNGVVHQFASRRLDTMGLTDMASVAMTARFFVAPELRGKTVALYYRLSGSVRVVANGDSVLESGLFNKTTDKKMDANELEGFTNLVLHDTVEQINISYVPDKRMKIFNLKLKLMDLAVAERDRENTLVKNQGNTAVGFYYLSFAIVFMLVFLFSREKTENLYFSLFCLCASFSFVCSAGSSYLSNVLSLFFFVFALEFMSFFLAKVLKNKNKSRISLVVRLVITAACFYPAILYDFSFFGLNTGNVVVSGHEPVSATLLVIFAILFCISGVSSIYYLLKGFKQKRWEARTIVFVCCLALLFSLLLSVIASCIPPLRHWQYYHGLKGMGIYLYPLSAVIVLGRTNRLNQKKLLDQVNSIKQLSEQNLEKEREKQLLLETQNTELENKVTERTRDIIKQKEELEIKKQEIEIKNKAITDNINYAQRIQSAILPDIKLIYKALEQSFILFMPKDIVSGDFYAFAEKNNKVVIIAGDCTGHGVSGALMSMIGSSLLNQIINEKGIEQPAQILDHLNSAVITALKQSENESNDGMDISICSFDLAKRELQFAGANRPLWLVRQNTLEVYRPDKFPIGGLQAARNRAFTNHSIPLQQGDSIYIFTDGYADQFGGEKGKKLMTAKFKEMLLAIQQLDMRAQERYLKTYFEQWKDGNEQVDDVLVIGVRV